MIHAGIRDVKNNLSRLLLRVKAGQEVVITERGKPVARIVREETESQVIRKSLTPLIQSGTVALPSRARIMEFDAVLETQGKTASEMVIEDRR